MIERTMRHLRRLDGTWTGKGAGDYPTIDPFGWTETLRFELDDSYPMLHYEQRTHLVPSGEASHWESGFIRPLEDGSIEISSSQDSGRVEVLRGRLKGIEDGGGDWSIELDSVVLEHDPRLQATRRVFTLSGDTLLYVVSMATHTTPEPRLSQHLEARLRRSS